MGPQKAVRKSKKLRMPSIRKQTCPYPGRFAYIHAHPLMIVDIDTIASDDGGHRGTGGGGGQKQGWIVGQGEKTVSTKLKVMYGRWQIWECHRGAGRCMYVHGKDECDVLWQMIPMRIDMAQGRLD
jgi:hypothetical protein